MELIGIASGTFRWIKRAEKALEFVDNVSFVSFADSFEIQRDKNVNEVGGIIWKILTDLNRVVRLRRIFAFLSKFIYLRK